MAINFICLAKQQFILYSKYLVLVYIQMIKVIGLLSFILILAINAKKEPDQFQRRCVYYGKD